MWKIYFDNEVLVIFWQRGGGRGYKNGLRGEGMKGMKWTGGMRYSFEVRGGGPKNPIVGDLFIV